MLGHTGFSRLEMRLAEALVCKPELVRNVWQELQLDSFEDVHNIKQLAEIVKTYNQMKKLTNKLLELYESLPEEERQRLIVEAHLLNDAAGENKLARALNSIKEELSNLINHRDHVKERNPSKGGKDHKADQLAEFVAKIFEETNRPITYGHRDTEPTTDFGRAVQKTLEICEAKLLDRDYKIHLSNWRQPAHKAFARRRS